VLPDDNKGGAGVVFDLRGLTMPTDRRPDPEQLLLRVEAEEKHQKRGRLKVFLGYAGGVGKSFRMLDEGRRRRERGEDVIVGAIQTNPPPDVETLLRKMEVFPFRMVAGTLVMDTEAILRRHPQVCLVDSLAYDNPPGSRNPKRWQDVEQLLQAGISVIASVNLQYIESQQDRVERITGKRATETVPQTFLNTADEIELVDAPPEMALRKSGDAAHLNYSAEHQEKQLSELRELALLLAAEVVDRQLETYLRLQGIEQPWGTQERIMVWITPHSDAGAMLASGRRNADRFRGELYAACFSQPDLPSDEKAVLDQNLVCAHDAGARVEMIDAEDQVDAILQFAHAHGITQIFVQRQTQEGLWKRLLGSPIDHLIQAAEGIDVRVFPQ
jgi:two-component system, OmpR family, sensor histidine kinase KdpD